MQRVNGCESSVGKEEAGEEAQHSKDLGRAGEDHGGDSLKKEDMAPCHMPLSE